MALDFHISTPRPANATPKITPDQTKTTLATYGSVLSVDSAGNLYMTNSGVILELSNGVVTTIGGGTGVAF